MQNKQSNPATALNLIEPKTKSARIKSMHALIESKIASGVHLAQIVEVLNAAGLDINLVTLKSYLYRLRKKSSPARSPSKPDEVSTKPMGPSVVTDPQSTLSTIDSIINQDPASQAQEIARYERLAKSTRRKS